MKNVKLFTALLAVALVAGMTIFNACKKEGVVKNATPTEWQEKIEYMDIPCVDFSRINKNVNLAKGETLLQFESWEHYASVIDAMLEFSYNYIDTRVKEILQENPNIDEDDLSEIIHNEWVYQFMPLYSFCQQLQFDNSAFKELRTAEIQWTKQSQTSEKNPFDEMGLGYIQSALHNSNGDVLIGNEIFNPKQMAPATCPTYKHREEWVQWNYNGKKRLMICKITSTDTYTYGKTSTWYYIGNSNNRVVWCCNIKIALSGKRWKSCSASPSSYINITGSRSVFASVVEKYCWYSKPNYLDFNNAWIVFTTHTAPGKTNTQGL